LQKPSKLSTQGDSLGTANPEDTAEVERLLGRPLGVPPGTEPRVASVHHATTLEEVRRDEQLRGGARVIQLEHGRAIEVLEGEDSAKIHVRDESGAGLDIQIRFDASGPIVQVRATSLLLEASEHVVARCETFTVEARQKIELVSQGELLQQAQGDARISARNVDVVAEPGGVRLKANDDVQLLGENVLLNCDRPKPLPEWTQKRIRTELTLPPEQQSGDAELIELLSD
jgi:hypothetical protein